VRAVGFVDGADEVHAPPLEEVDGGKAVLRPAGCL
jgi:hypothetical protein